MSENPQQPRGPEIPDPVSIDQKIAEENLKIYQNSQKKQPKEAKGLREFARSHPKSTIVMSVIVLALVSGLIGLTYRPGVPRSGESAKAEEMPEIVRKTDVAIADTNNDGTIDKNDEQAELDKLISEKGFGSYSDDDNSIDPFIKDDVISDNGTGTNEGGSGYRDDNLGDTADDSRPYENDSDLLNSLETESEIDNSEDISEGTDLTNPDIATDTPKSSQTGNSITIASWNIYYPNSTSNVASGAGAVGSKAQIIGFQEMHRAANRRAMRDRMLCGSCAYSGYVKDYSSTGSSPSSLSIIWRKDRFVLNSAGYYKVSGAMGSGSNKISAKWITWVKLRDKNTNKLFYVLNTHLVASVESSGKASGSSIRVNNYVNHMNVLTAKINTFKQENTPLFITGDFNVNHRYDAKVRYKDFPFKRLGAVGVHSNWYNFEPLSSNGISKSAGTHGGGSRLIDYVWSADGRGTSVVDTSISSNKYGSDHRPVFLTFNLASASSN